MCVCFMYLAGPTPCGLLYQYVKEHRQSIVDDAKVRRIKHKKPYAEGTRRGYGLTYVADYQPKMFFSLSWNSNDFIWLRAVL